MKTKNIYLAEFECIEWEKEYFLKLPQELLIKLDWSEGDELKFEVQDDSTITISKEDKE
jgi:bifunctional DNA-binding transcriptional regulator/antitoxin component of YhaV-PrlF toxin-antitoxin module